MITAAEEALSALKAGNERFVKGQQIVNADLKKQRQSTIRGQAPFAIILGCSDSRVPVEYVFDQGVGDLFVIRVAGNIASDSQLGSIEYAVAHFNTPLVVVLGHSCCGAVEATTQMVKQGGEAPGHLDSIVEFIKPSVNLVMQEQPNLSDEAQLDAVIKTNVGRSIAQVKAQSALLSQKIESKALMTVGAFYDLTSGKVSFWH